MGTARLLPGHSLLQMMLCMTASYWAPVAPTRCCRRALSCRLTFSPPA